MIPGLVLYAHCVTHCQRGQATCVLTAGDSRSGSVCALCHPLPTGAGGVLTAGDSRSGSVCALCHPLPTGAGNVCAHSG